MPRDTTPADAPDARDARDTRDALDDLTLDEGSPLLALRASPPTPLADHQATLWCPPGRTDPRPCTCCCGWALPIHVESARRTLGTELPHGVALRYQEWLVWHLHVCVHQAPPPEGLC